MKTVQEHNLKLKVHLFAEQLFAACIAKGLVLEINATNHAQKDGFSLPQSWLKIAHKQHH